MNLDFKPMPKRFMVWDKGNQKFMYFIDDDGYERFMVDISELYVLIEEYGYSYEDVVIIQSTNLFDKDGKEIFEGSIVEHDNNRHVVIFKNGCFIINNPNLGFFNTGWCLDHVRLWKNDTLDVRVIGHILSNPELEEEK